MSRADLPASDDRLRADDWVGEVLGGRWRIRDVLDRWGPGLAFDARSVDGGGEPVRLLLLPASGEVRARARRELARAIDKLSEPPPVVGVVAPREHGEAEGVLWVVADDLEAMTLARLLAREGALGPRRACRLALHVCTALADAHRRGIAHGGVSAEAALVTSAGARFERAWLADFGLAEVLGGDAGVGADPGADVLGVGLLLRAMVGGEGDAPPKVAKLIRWCVARDPRDRPDDLDVVRRELDRILEGRADTPWDDIVVAGRRVPTAVRRWLVVAGVALAALAVAAGLLRVVPANRDVERGHAALAGGDAGAAVLAFESALGRAPGRRDALLGLARAEEALGLHVSAAVAWERLLAADPASVEARVGLARRRLAEGRPRDASLLAEQAAGLDAASAAAHLLHGEALEAAGRRPEAVQAYERAATLAPSDPEAHYFLGRLLSGDPERVQRATDALSTAVRLAPSATDYRVALARHLRTAGPGCDAARAVLDGAPAPLGPELAAELDACRR